MNKTVKVIILVYVAAFLLFSYSALAAEVQSKEDKDLEYLRSVMDMIKEKYKGEVTDKQLIEGALKGMFNSMDKYTVYYNSEESKKYIEEMEGNYEGIGVMLNKEDDYIMVVKVFNSSPAERAGIAAGDKIVAADGKSLDGISVDEAVALIKGKTGTEVALEILRKGQPGTINVKVEREHIKIIPVSYEIRGGIGYIKLEAFNGNADEFLTKALEEMDGKNIKKIVLDLRDNPGGELEQAVAVAKKFVLEGLITKLDFKSEQVEDEEYYSDLKKTKYKLVVLVNGMSASASEVVAGAIQDTEAGVLVGTKTFGKSKVQIMFPMLTPEAYKKYEEKLGVKLINAYDLINNHQVIPKQSEIIGWTKITIGEYTTPKGRVIDQVGLTPDIIVENNHDTVNVQKLSVTTKPALNSEGTDVYIAEKILKLSGYDVDTPDMKLDKKTFKAIAKFQKDQKMHSYGVLDFTTQKALNKMLNKLIFEMDKQYMKAVEELKMLF